MAPLKKKWVSHPILDDDEVLSLAARAGAGTSTRRFFDHVGCDPKSCQKIEGHGIGVEGTIILGTDDQDENDVKRLVDFVQEIDMDMAEFTVLTP